MAAYNKLEGELVRLDRVKRNEWAEVLERFQTEALYDSAGLKKPPEQAPFFEDLDEDELIVFHITPHEGSEPVAYGVFVNYDGPPYIFVYFFNAQPDVEFAGDAMLQMVLAFFQNTEEPRLYTFLPRPVDEDIHDKLLESGFDHIEDYPVINNDEEACYCLERFTYEAYYQDEEEDDVAELDF
ncbi:MAG: hypothetical protein AAF658_17950 [Myxococcota bacterium]